MVMPRRPSPTNLTPTGSGGLWDMLERWGYLYFATANALTYAETALEQYRSQTGGTVAGHGTSILDPHSAHADLVAHKCDEVLRFIEGSRDDLTPIPFRLEMLRTKLRESRKPHQLELYTNDILEEVRRILNDFLLRLSVHNFYYVPLELAKFYGKPLLFGPGSAASPSGATSGNAKPRLLQRFCAPRNSRRIPGRFPLQS